MRLKIVAAAIAAIGLFLGISYINFASTEAANKHAAANAAFRESVRIETIREQKEIDVQKRKIKIAKAEARCWEVQRDGTYPSPEEARHCETAVDRRATNEILAGIQQ